MASCTAVTTACSICSAPRVSSERAPAGRVYDLGARGSFAAGVEAGWRGFAVSRQTVGVAGQNKAEARERGSRDVAKSIKCAERSKE